MTRGVTSGVSRTRESGHRGLDLLHRLEQRTDADAALGILERALELAQLHSVPHDRPSFALFVCGPLFDAVAEQLSQHEAAQLSDELMGESETDATIATEAPIATESSRSTGEPAHPSQPAPTTVIVASADEARSSAIAERLGQGATVHRTSDVVALVARIEASLAHPILLVIDGAIPGLAPALVPTLARLLPSGSTVVLAGDPPSGLYDTALNWATVEDGASVEELVVRCRDALPRARPVVVLVDPDLLGRPDRAAALERDAGCVVHPVEDALSALDACILHAPDLVVSEQELPSLDGAALARLVRDRLGRRAPPVVLRGARSASDPAVVAVVADDTELMRFVRALRG